MAGIKTRKGTQTHHSKYYAKGQEWIPCTVVQKKRYSNGTRPFMAAQSVQTDQIYKNAHGNTAPWHSIPFTNIKPDGLE